MPLKVLKVFYIPETGLLSNHGNYFSAVPSDFYENLDLLLATDLATEIYDFADFLDLTDYLETTL